MLFPRRKRAKLDDRKGFPVDNKKFLKLKAEPESPVHMSEIKPTKMPAAVNGSVVSNDAGTILPMLCDINMPFYKKCLWKSQLSVICNHHDHFFPGLILNNVDREMIWNSSQFVSSFVLAELSQILSKLFIIFWNCSSREFRGTSICDVYLVKSCSLPLFCFKLGSTNPNYLKIF